MTAAGWRPKFRYLLLRSEIGVNLVRTPIALTDVLLKRLLSRSGALQRVKTKWRKRLREQVGAPPVPSRRLLVKNSHAD